MKKFSLSVEEVIFCFYSEGYFEQGNALRQVYFGDLGDEKVELMLETANRSLLSKDLLIYKNRKFTMVDDLKEIVIFINSAEQTVRSSKHGDQNAEEATSYHIGDSFVVKQYTKYDDQVHVFEKITDKDVVDDLVEFFGVSEEDPLSNSALKLTQEEFEGLLEIFDSNDKQFDLPHFEGEMDQFFKVLWEANGKLNTLMFIEFSEKNEPIVDNVILFTDNKEKNYEIEKIGDNFNIKLSSRTSMKELMNKYTKVPQ
ncbi:hypothetical protein [Bacillus sp. JJ1566]|uniref:hypothetical protein n=1 Tax=Bacillus sp. JJ1566 TaxID=3122961 RepID=UPI00300009CE